MQEQPSIGALVGNVKRAVKARDEIPDALRNFDSLPNSAFVRLPVVCGLTGQSPATVWRRVASGALPQPHRFSAHCSAWSVGELRAALAGL